MSQKHAVVDIETYDPLLKKKGQSYIYGQGYIIGVGIYVVEEGVKGFYEPTDPYVADILNDPDIIKICHNGIYDLSWLNIGYNLPVRGRIEDTMTRDALLDAYALSHSLQSACSRMGVVGKNKEDTIENWWLETGHKTKAIEHLPEIPREIVARYCIGDLEATWSLYRAQEGPLTVQKLCRANDIECRLYPFLLSMKRNGMRVDEQVRSSISQSFHKEHDEGIEWLRDKYGIEPRLSASSYLKRIWEIEGLPFSYTEKGSPSFTREILDDIDHPTVHLISRLRKLEKLLSTFIDGGIAEYEINGHIYPDFFPSLREGGGGTVTGRYSSRNPNAQAIPARADKYGTEIRSIFIPEDNCLLGSFDYKQIEYRVFLHFAVGEEAEKAQQQFRENPDLDYHAMTMQLLNWDNRYLAKCMSFGSLYGLGPKSFAERFKKDLLKSHPDVKEDEVYDLAKSLMDEYFHRVPFVRPTMDLIQEVAIHRGYVKTLSGRRQRLNDTRLAYKMVNYLVQGSASDILKKGQVDAYEAGVFDVLKIHATVHDENVFSAPNNKEGREAVECLAECMEGSYKDVLKVPIRIDKEMGVNWGHCNSDNTEKYLRGEFVNG